MLKTLCMGRYGDGAHCIPQHTGNVRHRRCQHLAGIACSAVWLLQALLLPVTIASHVHLQSNGGSLQTQRTAAKSRLLVAYVAGNDEVSQRRLVDVHTMWRGMQFEYPAWSIRCMVVTGGYTQADFLYRSDPVCSSLKLNAHDGYLQLGHKIKAMMQWIASRVIRFDFLLKADLDTFICFSMVTDLIDTMRIRFGTDQRIYLGHLETCSRVVHHPQDKFYDKHYLEDVLQSQNVDCYPPYMQGLGYVLSRDLVQLIGFMAPTLKVYTNEDMMVGIWLVGHQVNRGQLVAKTFSETWYQTTLSECFPLYYNHKVPSFVMRECTHFHTSTGLCWQPSARAAQATAATTVLPLPATATPKPSGPPLNELMQLASTANAVEQQVSGPTLARIQQLVTVCIKAVTHLRNHVHFMLHSVHRRYPGVRIIIADDEYIGLGGEEWKRLSSLFSDLNVTYMQLVPRSGLSAGRNALAAACQTKYMVLLDDDVFFTASTRLDLMLSFLESRPTVQIVAGSYAQYDSRGAATVVDDYSLLFERSGSQPLEWRAYRPPLPERWGSCRRVHAAHNFFMARTETLRKFPWHPKLAIFEHEHFFLQLFLANQVVFACPHVSVFHHRAPNMHDTRYIANSIRFKEHLFARYFCEAFAKDVAHFTAPYWTYDCIKFELCPQWTNTSSCTPMIDPDSWTKLAITATPFPETSGSKRSNKGAKEAPDASKQVARPLLVLGEAGSGAGLVAQLLRHSTEKYMLWREPNSWRFSSRIPDNLLGEMLASLYRCELSSQQLALLHTQAPDYVNEAPLNGDVDAGQLPPPQSDLLDETELETVSVEEVVIRYSEKGVNSSQPRFCGPQISTALCLTRFQNGMPPALRAMPVNVWLMVRNPVDIVVARVQARRQRGLPVWPECTTRTVDACAETLCGSMERMLDSLPSGDHVQLIKWEQFSRRKTRTIREIFTGANAPYNESSLKTVLRTADRNIRTFNALAEKSPLSFVSKQRVIQRCYNVMARLDYNDSVVEAVHKGLPQAREIGQMAAPGRQRRSTQIGRTAAFNTTTADSDPRLVIVQHAYKPSFYFCPIQSAGADIFYKYFIKRDVPDATLLPSCWPTEGSDVCPSNARTRRAGTRWPRRWGAYPFEPVDVTKRLRKAATRAHRLSKKQRDPALPGLSFAVVRNPWERLVAAYQGNVDVPDKRGQQLRSWIREFHQIPEKETLTFSHFVRWLVTQTPALMDPAWKPLNEVCRFNTLKYTFVARLENAYEDMVAILKQIGIEGKDEEHALLGVLAKRLAMSGEAAPGSADRTLRVLHYYLSDDKHDLVELVRQKYRDDIRLFDYEFPMNRSFAPWTRSLGSGGDALATAA